MIKFLSILPGCLVALSCFASPVEIDLNDKEFPTSEQQAFIQEVSELSQRRYGFPVHNMFSTDQSHKVVLYLVYASPEYTVWPFEKTKLNQFYVDFGASKKTADSIKVAYEKNGYDVYLRSDGRFWSAVPETTMVITPEFFINPRRANNVLEVKPDTLEMLNLLFHESFHQYVHQYDIGLSSYKKHLTIHEMSEEEVLATILGQLGAKAYYYEKVYKDSLIQSTAKRDDDLVRLGKAKTKLENLSYYFYMIDIYQTLNDVYEDSSTSVEFKKQKKQEILKGFWKENNAKFLSYYIYYGNNHMKKYINDLVNSTDEAKVKLVIQEFIKDYWLKVKNR